MSKVYIVPFFDAEGPSDCSHKAEKANQPNLGKAKAWDEIEKSIGEIISDSFRKSHKDSSGEPIKYTWSWLDWVGFTENPRKQVTGFHAVYDHLKSIFGENMERYGDGDALHYHNPRPDGSWMPSAKYPHEQWNKHFEKETLNQILAHYLIDKNWFPTVFRAGGTIEDEPLSHFLENHIPLDFSSRGGNVIYPADATEKNMLVDWRGTPHDWSFYHPNKNDYRKPGNMQRVIFMSLDQGKLHSLDLFSKERVRQGFARAASGKPTIISYFSHDFVPEKREIIEQAHEWITEASKEYRMPWSYEAADAAAKKALKKTDKVKPGIRFFDQERRLILSDKELLGIPFVAVKTESVQYITIPSMKAPGGYTLEQELPKGTIYISLTDTHFNNSILSLES